MFYLKQLILFIILTVNGEFCVSIQRMWGTFLFTTLIQFGIKELIPVLIQLLLGGWLPFAVVEQ